MNTSNQTYTLLSFLLLFQLSNISYGQDYTETFPDGEKGILQGHPSSPTGGCPTNDPTSCTSYDFTGVNWMINGDLSQLDVNDYVKTIGGIFQLGGDIDEEICWESPLLDISATGSADYSVFIEWRGQDDADYIDVEYQVDGSGWDQISNQFGGGSHTIDYGTSGNSGSGTITQNGISGITLSVRVCADTNTSGESTDIDDVTVTNATTLPVELISFKAMNREDEVLLKWATASEINNERFDIEHRTNNTPFEKIGEVEGNATTLRVSNYDFKHKKPTFGINYYRLKQVDFDERFQYTNVASVTVQNKETRISEFYPNPSTNGVVSLNYTSIEKTNLAVSVYSANGEILMMKKNEISNGENRLNFDFSSLSRGVYFVRLSNSNIQEYRKLFIQ